MLRSRIAICAIVGLLSLGLLGGCGKKLEDKVVGKFKGEIVLPEAAKKDAAAKAGEEMMKALMSSLALELKEDKTFTMTMLFPLEGKWAVDGETLTLTTEKFMGMSMAQAKETAAKQGKGKELGEMEKPLKFTVSDDGQTLTAINEPGKKDQGSMVFKKETASK